MQKKIALSKIAARETFPLAPKEVADPAFSQKYRYTHYSTLVDIQQPEISVYKKSGIERDK